MTQTFTHDLDLNVKLPVKEEKIPFTDFAEPSKNVIQNILNYGKNLEVKHSNFFAPIEIIKS